MKLTKAQRRMLEAFRYGGTVASPRSAWAPIRRLWRKGMIVRTGDYFGRGFYSLSEAGRLALSQNQEQSK